jgi:hypothetical protein
MTDKNGKNVVHGEKKAYLKMSLPEKLHERYLKWTSRVRMVR